MGDVFFEELHQYDLAALKALAAFLPKRVLTAPPASRTAGQTV
jgi:hypothetical protein